MTPRSTRLVSGVRQTVLSIGAVLGLVCIAVALAAVLFGVRPLVFRSGSMSPTIGTGALAISHQVGAADLRRGDVVSVQTPSGSRVTHRIHAVEHQGGTAILQLKGDANAAVDATPYRVTRADVVLFHVPWIGYGVGWLTSPMGLVLLGLYAAFLLSVLVRGRVDPGSGDDAPADRPTPRSRGGRRRKETGRDRATRASAIAAVVALTLASGVLLQQRSAFTLAAWTDGPTVSGAKQTAYTVPAPDGSTCTVWASGTMTSRGVDLTFPAVTSPATTYTGSVTGLSGATATVTGTGATRVIQVRYNPGTTANQGVTATVTATARLTSTASWVSPTTSWKFRTGGNKNTQPICGDATPAVVAIQAPDGATRTPAAERAFISGASGCTSDIGFCGTIQDASTISSVTYILKRTQGSTVRCFNGTAWGTTCTTQVAALTTTYQNQLTFYEDSNTATLYPDTGTGSYVLTVTTTDSWQNVTTTVVSFTLA